MKSELVSARLQSRDAGWTDPVCSVGWMVGELLLHEFAGEAIVGSGATAHYHCVIIWIDFRENRMALSVEGATAGSPLEETERLLYAIAIHILYPLPVLHPRRVEEDEKSCEVHGEQRRQHQPSSSSSGTCSERKSSTESSYCESSSRSVSLICYSPLARKNTSTLLKRLIPRDCSVLLTQRRLLPTLKALGRPKDCRQT